MSDKELEIAFENFDLSPVLIGALEKCGHKKPPPIQEKSIPILNEGKDLWDLLKQELVKPRPTLYLF